MIPYNAAKRNARPAKKTFFTPKIRAFPIDTIERR